MPTSRRARSRMALCERCGSISIVKVQRNAYDKLVAFFIGKRPFLCQRCGWRGRRNWSDRELESLRDYGAGGAEPDPDLVALDDEFVQSGNHGRVQRSQESEDFDLGALNLSSDSVSSEDIDAEPSHGSKSSSVHERRISRTRRKRSRMRKMVSAAAVTALVLMVVALLGVTRSCTGQF